MLWGRSRGGWLLLALAALLAAVQGNRLGCAGCRALREEEQACPVLLSTGERAWASSVRASCRVLYDQPATRIPALGCPPTAHPPPLPPLGGQTHHLPSPLPSHQACQCRRCGRSRSSWLPMPASPMCLPAWTTMRGCGTTTATKPQC